MLYFLTDALVLGCINAIMVVGLNLQYGYSGLLNFAFYIYVAVGAYIAAITTGEKYERTSAGTMGKTSKPSLP